MNIGDFYKLHPIAGFNNRYRADLSGQVYAMDRGLVYKLRTRSTKSGNYYRLRHDNKNNNQRVYISSIIEHITTGEPIPRLSNGGNNPTGFNGRLPVTATTATRPYLRGWGFL